MLDEEMDHIIREAADNHHPPYNDKAWEKMKVKLDKHLPEKKDRKKLVFFLLFFLLAGATFFFTINRFTGNKNIATEKKPGMKAIEESATESLSPKPANGKDQGEDNGNAGDQITGNPDNNKTKTTLYNLSTQHDNNNNSENLNSSNKKTVSVSKGKTNVHVITAKPYQESQTEDEVKTGKNPRNEKTAGKTNIIITGAVAENNESESMASISTGISKQEETKRETNIKDKPGKDLLKVNKDEKEKDLALTTDKPLSATGKTKSKKNFAANFGLTFSAGPELSFVEINKSGKVTLSYGAGISYNFAKRLMVRTGFYFSKKIYEAGADQYHTPGGVNYPNLTGVNSDCKVYEIPVNLSYSFGQSKKHNWFGNVGLSSFIMKNEEYVYNYKTPAGQTYNYYKEISNENKHYFAVLTLSGGYQYQLNKRLSIQAEPYLKLPLSGIGLGKVKLNSSGILFTVTLKPFAKGK